MEKIHPVIKLFLSIILLYVGWYIFYQFVLVPGGAFDFWLTQRVTAHSVGVLNLISADHFGIFVNPHGKCSILRENLKVISVNHACNGQVLYPVFISFIIVTKGSWRNKLLMVLLGSLVIYIVNLIRVISLVYVRIYFPKYLDFNHKYTFVIFVYSVIFALWVFWVHRFSKLKLLKNA